jgi:hypothetical protein
VVGARRLGEAAGARAGRGRLRRARRGPLPGQGHLEPRRGPPAHERPVAGSRDARPEGRLRVPAGPPRREEGPDRRDRLVHGRPVLARPGHGGTGPGRGRRLLRRAAHRSGRHRAHQGPDPGQLRGRGQGTVTGSGEGVRGRPEVGGQARGPEDLRGGAARLRQRQQPVEGLPRGGGQGRLGPDHGLLRRST